MACLLAWLFVVLLVVETQGLCPTSGNVGSITFSPGPTVAPLSGGAPGVWTTTATYVSLIADGSTILTPTISSDSADAVLNLVGTTYILTMLEEGTIFLHVTNGATVDACVEIRVIAGGANLELYVCTDLVLSDPISHQRGL